MNLRFPPPKKKQYFEWVYTYRLDKEENTPWSKFFFFLRDVLPILSVVWCWMYNYEIFPMLIAVFRDKITYWNAATLPLDHIWTNRSNCTGHTVFSWGFPCHQMSQSRMWTNSSQRKYNKCSVQWYPSQDWQDTQGDCAGFKLHGSFWNAVSFT